MIIDHVCFAVADFEKSKAFYQQALAPLGISILMEETAETTGTSAFAGFGTPDSGPKFWLGDRPKPVRHQWHVAFAAPDRASVDAFYHAAIAAGGIDNGAPGPRPHYHEHYYGAFILDPDGVNIEAVCHTPAP
ncbi:VOC family protein [Thalassospira sp.]|uniref:VOC family protein n=1 Tax=Thalassospira sp. TaxID=1912094 RepID=UPI002733985F|nr:VOC family protein [Thalassospira sp.]MDP2697495.1 VOC family protein [Thalassospira sp.]